MLKKNEPGAALLLAVVVFIFAINNAASQSVAEKGIIGFWEGEFMPGNNFTLVLIFQSQDDESLSGRILLFQGQIQIQDDACQNITLDDNQLSFLIEAKNTRFKGSLESDGRQIKGDFVFPDGAAHPITANKVMRPSLGAFAEIKEGAKKHNILETTYSVVQLQEDFNFLRQHLEKEHPQLYLYTSKQEFNNLFETTQQSINIDMSEDEFFRLIAPVVAKVNCCHTGIRFSNEFSTALNNHAGCLPLDIRFIDDEAYTIADYRQNPGFKAGVKILSINGTPMPEILQKLIASVPSDGSNMTSKFYEISDNFSFVYSLYIGHNEEFDIEYIDVNGNRSSVRVPAQTANSIQEAIRVLHPEKFPTSEMPLSLKIMGENNAAMLTVKGFWAPSIERYLTFLQETFGALATENIQNLIIDVRGNKGGHPFFSAELFSFLAKDVFTYFAEAPESDEFSPLLQPMAHKEQNFNGRVFLLIDGGCLSSTGHFLSLVKYHNIATLIGEESGGSFYCNDGSIQLHLPNTKIELNLPQVAFETAVSGFQKGDPLLPDYSVQPKIKDILAGRDAVLDLAVQLIKENAK